MTLKFLKIFFGLQFYYIHPPARPILMYDLNYFAMYDKCV